MALLTALLAITCGLAANPATAAPQTTVPTTARPARGEVPLTGPSCPGGLTPTPTTVDVNAIQPPAAFDPTTASDSDLKLYGFPPRPSPGPHAAGWTAAMKSWKHKVTSSPTWTCGNRSHGGPQSSGRQTPATPNTSGMSAASLGGSGSFFGGKWAGNQVSDNLSGDYNGKYHSASLDWYLPIPGDDQNSQPSEISTWPGIGGGHSSNDQIVQAGTEADTNGGGSYTYRLWFEIFPMQSAVYAYPFTISHGDRLFVETWNDGGNAYFYIANESHGQSVQYHETFNGQTGSSAEWIVERGGEPLTTWYPNPFTMWADYKDSSFNDHCAGTAYHWSYHLTNTSGQDVAHGGAWTDPGTYCTFPMIRTSAPSN